MKTKKITDAEITPLKIASLPTRPTAPTAFGGKGYTSTQMKEAFDKLSLLIIERFNSLLDEITGDDGIAADIKTGFDGTHTLKDMISEIKSGEFAAYLTVSEATLASEIASIKLELSAIKEMLGGEKE